MEEIIQSILAISNNDNEDILRKLLERLQGKAIAEGMRRYERKLLQLSTGGIEREALNPDFVKVIDGIEERCKKHHYKRVERDGEFEGNQCDCGEWENMC